MKNEILDDNIVDALRDQLNKGEKIIWEGSPQKSVDFNLSRGDAVIHAWIFRVMLIFGTSSFIFGIIHLIFDIPLSYFAIICAISPILPHVYQIIQRKKTKYMISNQRIIFNLWNQGITRIHSIYFSEINGVIVERETNTDGVIYLALKHPYRIGFDTHNLSTGERRHQPTLEMVENVKEVGRYIRMGIHGKL